MKILLACCLCLLLSYGIKAQSYFTEKFTTTNGAFSIYSLSKTINKTIVIGANALVAQQAVSEAYIGELSDEGSLLWNRTFVFKDDKGATGAIKTNDDGYAMLTGSGFFVKLKSDHSTQFIKKLQLTSSTYIFSRAFVQTADNGYVITGSEGQHSSSSFNDIYLFKIDSAGNFQWSKKILDDGMGNAIIKTKNGGYAVAGISYVNDSKGDMCIVETDNAGNVVFSSVAGGKKYDVGNDVVETNDNGFLVAGLSQSFNLNNADSYLAKFSASGNLEWTKAVKAEGYMESWRILPDKHHTNTIVNMISNYSGGAGAYECLYNVSDNGKINRKALNFMDSSGSDNFVAACRGANKSIWCGFSIQNNGFAFIISKSDSAGRNCTPVALDLTEADNQGTATLINREAVDLPASVRDALSLNEGEGGTTIITECESMEAAAQQSGIAIQQASQPLSHISVYPNPASTSIRIIGLNPSSVSRLFITDITGKGIATAVVNGNSYSRNIEKLSSGVYYVRILSNNEITTIKFIKQ